MNEWAVGAAAGRCSASLIIVQELLATIAVGCLHSLLCLESPLSSKWGALLVNYVTGTKQLAILCGKGNISCWPNSTQFEGSGFPDVRIWIIPMVM